MESLIYDLLDEIAYEAGHQFKDRDLAVAEYISLTCTRDDLAEALAEKLLANGVQLPAAK